MYKQLLALHIAAGLVALTSMWIPIVARKGERAHRRAGWVFVGAMIVVSITALIMSGWLLVLGPVPTRGLFLLFTAVLTANAVSSGVRVLRTKERTVPHWHGWDVGVPAVLTLVSVAIGLAGLRLHSPQLLASSAFGLVIGGMDLRYWLRPPTSRMHWWFKHMAGMLAGCLMALNAFVSNFTHLGIWPGAAVAQSAVLGVGFPAVVIWIAYYKRRFSAPATRGQRERAASLTENRVQTA
jgi:uncharacterized membrane protein